MAVRNYIPETLEEALTLRMNEHAVPLAGGSDIMVQHRKGMGIAPDLDKPVMIISNLQELKGISRRDDGYIEIRVLETPASIAASELVPWHVRQAASRMGAIALRNVATIGGNIGNASPKGDLPQPLILLDAEVVLVSLTSERRMLLDQFILGSKKTALADDEIIKSVLIPEKEFTHLFYRKIGTRRANAISKLSLSAAAVVRDGIIEDFRASSGAAGPKVIRSREAESLLTKRQISEIPEIADDFIAAWDRAISPHAMPVYRRNTTSRMLLHFLEALQDEERSGIIE